jgi:membrane protease YdiL (CAAX protease family)
VSPFLPTLPPSSDLVSGPGRPLWTLLAWAVIVAVVCFLVLLPYYRPIKQEVGDDLSQELQARMMTLRATVVMVCAGLTILGLFVVGCAVLLLAAVKGYQLAREGRLGGITTGRTAGGVYAETFALWMLLYVGMSFGVSFLRLGESLLLAMSAGMVLSCLLALTWPLLRGVSWLRLRGDLGLGLGRQPEAEVLSGLAAYAAAIPMAAAGLVLMVLLRLALVRLSGPSHEPVHPVAKFLLDGNWWQRIQVLLAASVVAPLVEETMFRGVLYRHLREATGGSGRGWSVVLSALASGFIFAVIHPQGVVAVPVLMALATAFALVREWRQSLVPSMIAHAINNTLVTGILLLATA